MSKPSQEWLKPRTIFTAAFYGVFLYLVIFSLDVPDLLKEIVLWSLGVYYGSKMSTKKDQDATKEAA